MRSLVKQRMYNDRERMQREKNIVRILLYAPLKKLIKITILNVEKLVFSWDAIIDSQLLLDESFVESSW